MRYIKNILYALTAVLTISSCVSEVDDVFDKPSSQRIAETMAADKAVLVNQSNGWVLKIYGDLDFGGYNLLMKFNEDNTLKVVSEVYYDPTDPTSYEVETTHYKLEQSAGVVLSFDEFSENIHFFSNPANMAGLGEDGKGFYADLEFRVLSATADSVVLQGKKHGNRLIMLPSPVSESEWQGYLDQVATVEADMDCANYLINVGTESYEAKISYRNIAVTVPTEDGNVTVEIPYTVTPDGYSFYETVELGGQKLTGFKYVENSLVYPEIGGGDANLQAVVPPLNEQLINGTWYASLSGMGNFGTTYWGAIQSQIMPVLGENLVIFCLGKPYPSVVSTYGDYFGITCASSDGSSNYFSGFVFDYELTGDDTITMAYASNIENSNAAWYIKNAYFHYLLVPFGCSTDATAVARTFKLTTDNIKSPSYITLSDVNNENNVITLSATQIVYPMNR